MLCRRDYRVYDVRARVMHPAVWSVCLYMYRYVLESLSFCFEDDLFVY